MKDLIKRLRRFNDWRRDEAPMGFRELDISPKQIGLDIDSAINHLEDFATCKALTKGFKLLHHTELFELCRAVSKLERAGYKFCVDFGYENAIEKARQL